MCCIFLLLLIGGITLIVNIEHKVDTIAIGSLELSNISDGNYIGECSIAPVYVKVSISVKDHTLTDIEILEHANGLGSSAEVITDTVIKEQSFEVDAVSGATVSSKCILKAIENAIQGE